MRKILQHDAAEIGSESFGPSVMVEPHALKRNGLIRLALGVFVLGLTVSEIFWLWSLYHAFTGIF